MAESNVRGILSVDKAWQRWRLDRPSIVEELERRFRDGEVPAAAYDGELHVLEAELFKAGWAAAIQALIDAKQIKLVVNG